MSASATLAGLSPGQLAAIMEAGVTSLTARAFFTSEQREAVDAMAEAIIPTTDTPGASEAGVAEFIEAIVSEWYDAEQREHFMRGLAHHFPYYSFDDNKGYPCPRHKAALQGWGPSSIHRRSWVFMDHLPWTGLPRFVRPDPQASLFDLNEPPSPGALPRNRPQRR